MPSRRAAPALRCQRPRHGEHLSDSAPGTATAQLHSGHDPGSSARSQASVPERGQASGQSQGWDSRPSPARLPRRSSPGKAPGAAVAAVPAGEGSPQPGGCPQRGRGCGRAPQHGLHHAAPRGRPRALPRPQHALGGRGEPQRERHVGPVVRLLRGRRGSPQAAAEAGPHGDGEAAAGGERAGAGPDPERQHGLHRPADPHPHRARGSQALQDRDAPPGLQLHLPPGQRAAAGRGLRGWAALLQCHLWRQGRPGQQTAPQHLHLLPQQPAERGQSEGPRGQLPEGARGDAPASVAEMSRAPAAPT